MEAESLIQFWGNDEDVPDAGQHKGGQRVVDHGLVVDGDELLGDGPGGGEQARPRAAGEYDSPHRAPRSAVGPQQGAKRPAREASFS